jgi:uncharacterized DUF497 family protein
MTFEWDEAKRRANVQKHGIDFASVADVFAGLTATMEDDRHHYGEQRFITLGLLSGRVVVVVHTEREDRVRVISVRKATKNEQQLYHSEARD